MTEPKTEIVETLKNIQINTIKEFAMKLYRIKRFGKRIYISANGGSLATASHFASDLMSLGFDIVSMVDNGSRISALTNDYGFSKIFTEQMTFFSRGDALFIFTVHGASGEQEAGPWSQNLLEAAQLAKKKSGIIFVLSGNKGGYLIEKFPRENFLTIESDDVNVVEGIHSVLAHLICYEIKKEMAR